MPPNGFHIQLFIYFSKSAGAGLWQGNAMILFKRCRNGARDWIANVFLWRLRFEFEELPEYLRAQVIAIASPHAEPCNTANLSKAWERWSLEACRIMFKCVLVWTVSWCKQQKRLQPGVQIVRLQGPGAAIRPSFSLLLCDKHPKLKNYMCTWWVYHEHNEIIKFMATRSFH